MHNAVKLSVAVAFVAVSLAAVGARAQPLSPIMPHDVPNEPPAAASPQTMPTARPAATPGEASTASVQVPVYPSAGTTTPIHAVSMRGGPNTGAPVIGTLQPGMTLRVLATANYGWMQVDSPIGPGWVYGSYLAPGGTSVQPPAPPPEVVSH